MIQFENGCCTPIQIININEPIKNIDDIIINKTKDCVYKMNMLKFAYSIDMLCYSCYMDYNNILSNTTDMTSDFFIRIQVQGPVYSIQLKDYETNEFVQTNNWTTSISSDFNFVSCDTSNSLSSYSSNIYNPYANMDCAIKLQQQLSETVACMFGIPIYYFKVSGVKDSADITFKEYALKHVTSVKQIKMVIKDGQMPSSKPEFNDFGIDWQSDWEVEITKGMFATAFGNTEQPTEGDFIYIPMMKRMWMVNEAYEEKNEALMWVATTFKLALVKYQDDTMVDKSETEDIINNIVKNKYEDLFGDQEGIDSGVEATEPVEALPDNMTPVFESDACRKYIDVNDVEIKNANQNANVESIYYKGTLIADSYYECKNNININNSNNILIEYQRMYCGDMFTVSFLFNPTEHIINNEQGTIMSIGHVKLNYLYNKEANKLSIYNINNKNLSLEIEKLNEWYLIVFRCSKKMNLSDISLYKYKYPTNIPLYKLQKYHYYIDIDNGQTVTSNYNNELYVSTKSPVRIYNINNNSKITNIKVFDMYMDNVSEIMMQYPTNQHLIINDTARPIYGLLGVKEF